MVRRETLVGSNCCGKRKKMDRYSRVMRKLERLLTKWEIGHATKPWTEESDAEISIGRHFSLQVDIGGNVLICENHFDEDGELSAISYKNENGKQTVEEAINWLTKGE